MADPTLFAAPDAAAHGSAAGGALEVTLALLVVVAFIARAGLAGAAHAAASAAASRTASRCWATQAFGVKERCVLVRVGDTDILVGVAQGSVRALHVFPAGREYRGAAGAAVAPAPKLPNFKDLLMRSLGK